MIHRKGLPSPAASYSEVCGTWDPELSEAQETGRDTVERSWQRNKRQAPGKWLGGWITGNRSLDAEPYVWGKKPFTGGDGSTIALPPPSPTLLALRCPVPLPQGQATLRIHLHGKAATSQELSCQFTAFAPSLTALLELPKVLGFSSSRLASRTPASSRQP